MSNETRTTAAETVARLGLAVAFTFIPLEMSRNRTEPRVTVNWRATVTRNGKPVLETDYSAGSGHLPSAKLPGCLRNVAAKMEASSGRVARVTPGVERVVLTSTPLPPPDALDCLACLVLDAGALDYPTFESWASDFSLNEDSREAERCYRACLDTALRLRAAVGEAGLSELREAFADW